MKNLIAIILVTFSMVLVSCKKEKLEPKSAPTPDPVVTDTTKKNPYSFTLMVEDKVTYKFDTVDYSSKLYKIMNDDYYLLTVNGDTTQEYKDKISVGFGIVKNHNFDGKYQTQFPTGCLINGFSWYTLDKEGTRYKVGNNYSSAGEYEFISHNSVTGSFSVRVITPSIVPSSTLLTSDVLVYILK